MKKNEEPFQMKGKGMAAAIAICFIAVVALVGLIHSAATNVR